MAQHPPNFSTWSSSSGGANMCYEFGMGCELGSDAMDVMDIMDQPVWQHVEQAIALHHPTQVQIQLPDTLNGSLPEEVFPSLDHRVEGPGKIKTGRRRRASGSGPPDGWVASKNLISERRRREKLQKGLIALRELVPMFNMKMDRVSILTDAINHLTDLKRTVEKLESADSNDEDQSIDFKSIEMIRSSFPGFGAVSDPESEGENRRNSSTDGSFCSELLDDPVVPYDHEPSPSSRDLSSHTIQLDVTKLDVVKLEHGVYKLDIICMQQSGVLVQLSQAIEAFVIEVVHTSIVVITSTKVTCSFVVKMSSWNAMTLEDVRADIKMLLGKSGLKFS